MWCISPLSIILPLSNWLVTCCSALWFVVINYEVTVVTGNMRNGGTNANVFCQIYGEEGKTELISLKSRSNNFERGTTEIYKVWITLFRYSQ